MVDPNGSVTRAGDAKGIIATDSLQILPKEGEGILFSLRDLVSMTEGEYRIGVQLSSRITVTLFNLGYKYEDFARELTRAINEQSLKDLLMEEKLKKQEVRSEFLLRDDKNNEMRKGRCGVRLYETALVLMPDHGELLHVPYAEIMITSIEDFKVEVLLESGEKIEFSKLGREIDPLQKGITDATAALSLKVQEMLKDVYAEGTPTAILKASRFMKEGRAARKSNLENACVGLWSALEKRLASSEIGEEFAHLRSIGQQERMRIGMKRTLMGEMTGEYLWFLTPIYSMDKEKGGNAIAFEATSSGEEGRATYFFKIMDREEYGASISMEEMDRAAEASMDILAKGLIAINFRREPIYLSEDRLFAPEYARYRYSIMRIPELRMLRECFIGRVVHSSIEQWKQDVGMLLDFNVSQRSETETWRKSAGAG